MSATYAHSINRRSTGHRSQLVERESELRALADRLAATARGAGGVVYVESPPGTGASALLAAAAEIARESGITVLDARCSPLEREFEFGVALQLFEQCWLGLDPDDRRRLLDGPARGVGELLASPGAAIGGDRDPFRLTHGLLWFATSLAEGRVDRRERGLAVIVDDLQWADSQSVRFLGYLAARVTQLPICVIVSARAGERGPDRGAADLLQEWAAEGVMHLPDLSNDGVAAIVRERWPAADQRFMVECCRITGGNPLLVTELLTELERVAAPPDQATAAQLAELRPAPIVRAVRSRLGRLPEEAVAVAEAIAVLGGGTPIEVAATVAELDEGTTSRAADLLAAIGLLKPGAPLSYAQPLVCEIVADSVSALARGRLHSRAATALRDAGASAGQIARHLLATPPDDGPDARDVVRQAAGAAPVDAAGAAAFIFERALERLPDEAADALLGPSHLFSDELEACLELPDSESSGDPESAVWRSWALYHQGRVVDALACARAALPTASGRQETMLRLATAASRLALGQLDDAEEALPDPDDQPLPGSATLPLVLELRAQLELARMRPAEALRDALEAGRLLEDGGAEAHPGIGPWRSTAALAQIALGDRASARRMAEKELDLARRAGVTRAAIRAQRVIGHAETGQAAIDALSEAAALGESHPVRLEYVHALVDLGAALRRGNRRAAARRPLQRALELCDELGTTALAERARDELEASGGRPRNGTLTGLDALTPSERRVAFMAARGLTTRQIAGALFVTPKTVEFHLRHVYSKLDVPSSRQELIRRLMPALAAEAGPDGQSYEAEPQDAIGAV